MAVIQPASPAEALQFIKNIFPDVEDLPDVKDAMPTVKRWTAGGQIFVVDEQSKYYSVGAKGNHLLSVRQRRLRDKTRLFLLDSARAARLDMSGGKSKRLAGVSPAVIGSSGIQGARPISTASVPLRDALPALNAGRAYWPRAFKQLQVGSDRTPPDTLFPLYSFQSPEAIHRASDRPGRGKDLSITDLGLALGVSPRLLTSFIHKPSGHYREFRIGKRGGGERLISAPRVFLKVVQYWILDYLLAPIPVDSHCHAYRRGASIVTNASGHVRKRFVANADIKNFFPSIGTAAIAHLLRGLGFGVQTSRAVSRIATLNGGLPQGAPTSPTLSNLFLAKFDKAVAKSCQGRGLTYSRYADDITISGADRDKLLAVLRIVASRLAKMGLFLNEDKTRIASQNGQQKVTGVVVNAKAQPPRKLRRKVRAMFHKAELYPERAGQSVAELRGYLSYFNSFPALADTPEMLRLRGILAKISR